MLLDNIVRAIALSAGILINTAPPERVYAQQATKEAKPPRTFEQAKKGTDADKLKYLEWLLVDNYKLVYHEKRNPEGIVKKGFFYLPYKQHNTSATKEITQDAITDGANTPEKQKKYLDDVLEGIKERQITVRCRGHFGKPEYFDAYIIIDASVFEGTEDQLKSKIDYQAKWAKVHREGFTVSGRKLSPDASQLIWARRYDMAALRSYAEQAKNIINGTREIGATAIEEKLVEYYQICHKEQQAWIEYVEKDLRFKQAYEMMGDFLEEINRIMESVNRKIVIDNGTYRIASR